MRGQVYAESTFELIRLGKCTGSKAKELYTDPRAIKDQKAGKLSSTARTYLFEKVAEITTGTVRQVETSGTEWGKLYEPEAAIVIAERYPDFEYYGANDHRFFHYSKIAGGSPDGYRPITNWVCEIKCPEVPGNHIAHCAIETSEELKDENPIAWYQLQWNMACMAKEKGLSFYEMKGAFFSFYPLIREGYKKLHEVVIDPDKDFYDQLDERLSKAETFIKKMLNTSAVPTPNLIEAQ